MREIKKMIEPPKFLRDHQGSVEIFEEDLNMIIFFRSEEIEC
jgi:hypothetical protein